MTEAQSDSYWFCSFSFFLPRNITFLKSRDVINLFFLLSAGCLLYVSPPRSPACSSLLSISTFVYKYGKTWNYVALIASSGSPLPLLSEEKRVISLTLKHTWGGGVMWCGRNLQTRSSTQIRRRCGGLVDCVDWPHQFVTRSRSDWNQPSSF